MKSIENAFENIEGLEVCWVPPEEQKKTANITQFMDKHALKSYEQLLEKSVNDPEWFYSAILQELNIPWFQPYEKVLDLSNGVEMPLWFKGGLTNLYYYGLQKHLELGNGDHLALIWEGEDGTTIKKTYQQIIEETDKLASGLKAIGIKRGDRVGIFLPQIPEIQPILFACAKIGAIIIPCFSGFGAEAVATRLRDGEAKCLITADGYLRKGKEIHLKEIAIQVVELVPSIKDIIVVSRLHKNAPKSKIDDRFKIWSYKEVLSLGKEEVQTEPMGSEDPLMILYTSGTTGKPKGTLHTHFSFPLKNAIDMFFCFDLKRNDRMFWLTDLGWMMGPWLVFGTAINGATMVIYEGSPDYPNENRLWEIVDKHQITIFGIAPTVIRSLMKFNHTPVDQYNLSSLRLLGSTGEAWNPKPWYWFFEKVGGKKCPIINYSGGTEISGGILGCIPILPQKPCSFHGPVPGIAATVVDQKGKPVTNSVGDLVITNPFLGMTYSFWNDHNRYLESYWNRWEGIWHHGDLAKIDEDGFWYILGRSDDTMNIAGKRLGPSDLESVVVSHHLIKESAVIGVPDEVKGEVPILFAVPHEKIDNEQKVKNEILAIITEKLGKAFLPKTIYFVSQLPRTQSGKIARRLVRSAFLGKELGDISTLQNPDSLVEIQKKR